MTFKKARNFFEETCWLKNELVCGIDEVGRGCLAGPLVLSGVILRPGFDHNLLVDSKKLTEKKRLLAFEEIKKNSIFTVFSVSSFLIDKLNVNVCTKKAAIRILNTLILKKSLKKKLTTVLIDHFEVEEEGFDKALNFFSYPRGESWSSSIAAASIVAKVYRDKLLEKISKNFSKFELCKNKGYGSKSHIERVFNLGQTIIHREKFIKTAIENYKIKKGISNENQSSIF